jgi:hypothetical protein
LKIGGLGQAAGHQGDHGPQDHGFVAGWEACGLRLATIWIVIFKVAVRGVIVG